MRDQAVLVRNAVKNEIPAFALIGKDKFALQTLEYYYSLAKEECSEQFLKDLRDLIENDFKRYREENPEKIKVPDMQFTSKYKKRLSIPDSQSFANLKSNTMKNTLQRYGLLGYLQIFGVNYNILQHVLIDSTISLTFGDSLC